ncbi:tyrosine-type recombinase/integrase [Affinibrenneria salicis]|uniref:Tyrosine-type recombinase/integrase n=1 Tax=Affinibrenneria salicis TaxID=2590031 RepID=A0A5J5FQT2_9GAMM|nr:integrase arm-type DNA-binding domain-containing protein [Affinibrenneria salicis]KAA8995391.1 tyrosine-type recombinase/integrase [Affinibrenneria salicis]
MALTDAVARQARITGKAYTLNDTGGLSLFVTANGAKKWHFRFSLQGKQQRISLGSYPAFSLKQARQQRDELRAQLAAGNDPRSYRQQCNAAEQNTFDAVFRQWRDFKALSLETGRQSTLSQIDRIFAKDVLPSLGGLPIFDVEPSHILEVLRRIERRRAFTTAEKVRTWLNQLFRYAKVEKGVRYNPASDLDIVAAPRPPVTHNPFLRMDELPSFLRKLRDYNGQETTQQGLRLLLLTGVRTGELRLAEPDQFDLKRGLWIIPPASVKQLQVRMRREGNSVPAYVVPLPRQAIDIVKAFLTLQKRRPAQRYLLPNCNNLQKRISENTLNSALKRMGYADRLTGHGIRATISTALNELGYPKEWIEVQLSHADPNKIRAAYNHAVYVDQRRMMMQEWADRLDRWEAGEAVMKTAAPRGVGAIGIAASSWMQPVEGAPLLREIILR